MILNYVGKSEKVIELLAGPHGQLLNDAIPGERLRILSVILLLGLKFDVGRYACEEVS